MAIETKNILNPVHQDPTGQVSLYQTEDRYQRLLEGLHGQRFLEYRRRWTETSARGDPGPFPLSLDLAINSGCQLSCLMCPLQSRPQGRRVQLMDEKIFTRLMDQAREHQLPALTLGLGSEPLLNPGAAALTTRAVKSGIMDIRLGTNGLLLNAKTAAALVDGGLTRLEISVDAVRPETYRTIRGGNLDNLERAIEDFLEIRRKAGRDFPLMRLSFLNLSQNQGELEPFLTRWRGLADMLSIQEPIWFPGSGLPQPLTPGRALAPDCAQSWQRLAVNYDGHAWPCCSWYSDQLLSQNVAETSIAAIWRSTEMEALRRSLSGPQADFPPACRNCSY